MAKYGSLDEFRAALNGIIGTTGRRNTSSPRHKKSRRNPRARRNMAIRKHGAEFDTVEELIAYEQAMGISGPPAAPPARSGGFGAGGFGSMAAKATKAPARSRRSSSKKGKLYQDPYAKVAASVGGARQLCPGVDFKQVSGTGPYGKYATILMSMGLTESKLMRVLAAMDREGVLTHGSGARYRKSPEQQARARQILFEVGGISCAAANPRRRRSRRSW